MTEPRSQYDEQVLGIEDGPSKQPQAGGPVAPGQDIEGSLPSDVGLDPGSLADNTGSDIRSDDEFEAEADGPKEAGPA